MLDKKKEYIKKLKEQYQVILDDEGRSFININIDKEEDILSSFNTDKPIISSSLAEFINNQLRPMVIKNGIHINFNCSEVVKVEEDKYKEAIRNYYNHDLIDKNREISRNKIISIVMGIVGTIILTLSIVFSFFENLVIFASIIDIIAWVFLWEAVDLYVLQRPKIEMEELRDYEMANALITFNENKGSVESEGVLWGRQNKKL